MSVLPEIAREAEYKIKERSSGLIEKWKEMMVKEGEEPSTVDGSANNTGTAGASASADVEGGMGDLTMHAPEEEMADQAEVKKQNGDTEMGTYTSADVPEKNQDEAAFVPETNGEADAAPAAGGL